MAYSRGGVGVGVGDGPIVFGILLGVGGLAIGLLADPGPEVPPGGHGVATVVDVPLGCDALAVELEPAPLTVELPVLLVVLLLVEGVVVVAVPGGVEVELPMLPLLDGVHGATVVVVLDCAPCAPWLCVPRVPPVTLPGLLAAPGVTGVTEGVPVELAPGGLVVTVPELGVVAPG